MLHVPSCPEGLPGLLARARRRGEHRTLPGLRSERFARRGAERRGRARPRGARGRPRERGSPRRARARGAPTEQGRSVPRMATTGSAERRGEVRHAGVVPDVNARSRKQLHELLGGRRRGRTARSDVERGVGRIELGGPEETRRLEPRAADDLGEPLPRASAWRGCPPRAARRARAPRSAGSRARGGGARRSGRAPRPRAGRGARRSRGPRRRSRRSEPGAGSARGALRAARRRRCARTRRGRAAPPRIASAAASARARSGRAGRRARPRGARRTAPRPRPRPSTRARRSRGARGRGRRAPRGGGRAWCSGSLAVPSTPCYPLPPSGALALPRPWIAGTDHGSRVQAQAVHHGFRRLLQVEPRALRRGRRGHDDPRGRGRRPGQLPPRAEGSEGGRRGAARSGSCSPTSRASSRTPSRTPVPVGHPAHVLHGSWHHPHVHDAHHGRPSGDRAAQRGQGCLRVREAERRGSASSSRSCAACSGSSA